MSKKLLVLTIFTFITLSHNAQTLNLTIDWDYDKVYYEAGSTEQITWESQFINEIKIEYSTDAGKNWIMIEENYPAQSGSFDWTIPNTQSIYCKLQITDVASESVYDISPGDYVNYEDVTHKKFFTIYGTSKWSNVESPTNQTLEKIKFIDDKLGIAWGKNVLIETTNGGIDWNIKSEFGSNGATFVDQNTGWLIINNYQDTDTLVVLRTLDGGLNWETQIKLSNQYLYSSDISFLDSVHGWMSYSEDSVIEGVFFSKILKTTNGGISWGSIGEYRLREPRIILDSQIINKNSGWMKHKDGYTRAGVNPNPGTYISYTFDDGNNWSGAPKPYTSEYASIYEYSACFTDENYGWITQSVGEHVSSINFFLYKVSPDGNWDTLYNSYNRGIEFNYFTNNDVGWCLGSQIYEDEIYKFIGFSIDGGIAWELQKFDLEQDFPTVNNFFSLDGKTCWAVGNSGLIMKYTDNPTNVITEDRQITDEITLSQNFPNPFNPRTLIKYSIPQSLIQNGANRSSVQLKIYDVLGNEIITLVDEQQSPGNYEVEFNSKDYSSGIYFYKLQVGNVVETKKMILMK
ncbi:MAG: T9SS type A sorting domain-containing protein [Ignavibacteriae bacterium]|nr:T9SS type A sorting domain-containing protein [Ignavibacteriota bacterium]